jgi:excinuclease ABC subunit C
MRSFSSIEEVRKAEISDLKALPAMNEAAAKAVYNFFHPSQ